MNQTYGDIECILVDDATQDDSIDKCRRMIQAYQGPFRFYILHHERNRGLSVARNTGTDAAKGDYVFYLDGDDEMPQDCIEKMVKPVMNDETIEMVAGNYIRRADGCTIGSSDRRTLPLKEADLNTIEMVRSQYFGRSLHQAAWNKLIKREFLLRHQLYFKEGLFWEDTLWFFFVVKYLNHLYTIPDVTYYYEKRPDSITMGMVGQKELIRHWCMVYNEIAENFTAGDTGREARFHLRKLCFKCISYSDNKELRSIAHRYIKVLQKESYILDTLVLSSIVFLSRFSLMRSALRNMARKIYRFH